MSAEKLNVRMKELEGDLEKARQAATDSAQDLKASHHTAKTATVIAESHENELRN